MASAQATEAGHARVRDLGSGQFADAGRTTHAFSGRILNAHLATSTPPTDHVATWRPPAADAYVR